MPLKNDTRLPSLDVISQVVAAIQNHDDVRMKQLRSETFTLDLVPGDAFDDSRRTESEAQQFWPAWFSAFSESDYQVTRTIAADSADNESVVVTEWQFTGTNSGALPSGIFGKEIVATQKTIQFRGVTVYEIENGLILKETIYMDLATLWVELGVGL